jgi:CCR4-NOT transcription complex subunit 1
LSIVRSRVAKETKFHDVYLRFLEALGYPKLMEIVVSVTYDCINILLCYCDSAKESLSYRKLLKNLGSWLGFITLAQNKPLMSKCLDLKNLILDACEHDRLSVILPLCCKILEAVRLSKNFRPPNPWCVALLSLLTEIHEIPGLPTSFLFELELLFQNIGVSMNKFKGRTTHLLQYRHGIPQSSSQETYTKEQSGNKGVEFFQDAHNGSKASSHTLRSASSTAPVKNSFNAQRVPPSHSINDSSTFSSHLVDMNTAQHDPCCHDNYMSQPMTSSLDSDAALVRAFCPPFLCPMSDTLNEPAPANASVCDNNLRDISNKQKYALLKALSKSVIISPSIVLFKLKPLLKTVIPQALENAIREIVQVVAERSGKK